MCILHTDLFNQFLLLVWEYPILVSALILGIVAPLMLLVMLKQHWAEQDAMIKRKQQRLLLRRLILELMRN